jgi:hypothetical protein
MSGHEKIITKSGISLNAGTLNRGSTVFWGKMLPTFSWYPSSTLKMKEVHSSDMLVDFHQTTWHYISQDGKSMVNVLS